MPTLTCLFNSNYYYIKMNTICKMRDLYKALSCFENAFEKAYGLSLNEAMVLCALNESTDKMTSTALSSRTEMGTSHTSKVIRSVEEKGLIKRVLGTVDKRQMYFKLTPKGQKCLEEVLQDKLEVPEILRPMFF